VRPWRPIYDFAGEKVPVAFYSDICPREVARANPQAMELVQIYARSKVVSEKGVSLFAPGEMPAKMVDAFVVLANEDALVQNSADEVFAARRAAAGRRK
jgi:hypothetical protein